MHSDQLQHPSPSSSEVPLVSVGLPVYNGMPHLQLALESLVSQDYPNYEIVICDNCSTDETSSLCQGFAQNHSNIKYHRNSENIGANPNFEKVFKLSQGKYFMWAAHDDLWNSSYIRECVNVLETHPSVVIACTDVTFIDLEGKPYEKLSSAPHQRNLHTFELDVVQSIRQLISRSGWYSIYGLIRSEAVEELFPYLQSEQFGADVVWGIQLILLGDYYRINKRLFSYRIHDTQASGSQLHKAIGKNIKPYTSLFQNLLHCTLISDLKESAKDKIISTFIKTLAYENDPIFQNFAIENFHTLHNSLSLQQNPSSFVKTVIVDPVLSELESTSSSPLVLDNGRHAIVAYPAKAYSKSQINIEQRYLLTIRALHSLGYKITLFVAGIFDELDTLIKECDIRPYQFTHDEQNNCTSKFVQLTPNIKDQFDQLCTTLSPDLVIVMGDEWANLISNRRPSTISILDAITFSSSYEALRWETLSHLDSTHGHGSQIFEVQNYDFYDITLAPNTQLEAVIQRHTSATKVLTLPPIIQFNETQNTYSEPPVLILGKEDNDNQWYQYFVSKILPEVRVIEPDFTVQVLCDEKYDLVPIEGVLFVEDNQDHLLLCSQSKYGIVSSLSLVTEQPKLLEFMARGLPMVTVSEKSNPVFIVEHRVNGVIANNDQEFVNYLVSLYRDPTVCASLGAKAKVVQLRHDQSVLLDTYTLIYKHLYSNSSLDTKTPILIDGVFFQLFSTGIARVWRSLLEQWVKSGFSQEIMILDRAGTSPRIEGIRYRSVSAYDYDNVEADRFILQDICDQERADIFISTYYTTPISTPSIFMLYDMIPEVMAADLSQPMWREKHYGIRHASAFISISHNTKLDLLKFYPDLSPDVIQVAHCGVDPKFKPATADQIEAFRNKYGIRRPYFLLVGVGIGTSYSYKNTILFFRGFSKLITRQAFDIVCTGHGTLEPELREYTSGSAVHLLKLDDAELNIAYSGAIALVFPSKYEGFGMPVIEAMASGCPVITCPNASLPEVGGDAALFVDDSDDNALAEALYEVQKPDLRELMIAEGLRQSSQFSWETMAQKVQDALMATILKPLKLQSINLLLCPNWSAPEEDLLQAFTDILKQLALHRLAERITCVIYTDTASEEDANLFLSGIAMHLCFEEDIDLENGPEVSIFSTLTPFQWQYLGNQLFGVITVEQDPAFMMEQLPNFNSLLMNLDGALNRLEKFQ